MRILSRRPVRAALAVAGILIILLAWSEISFRTHVAAVYSQGNNGLWLRHSWVGDKHTSEDYRRLALDLRRMRVTDAYFHVGPLRGDGSLDPKRWQYAQDMLSAVHKANHDVRVCAWLGQVEAKGGGPLDISNAKVRDAVVRTAEQCLDMGFDGIHFDIEPVASGNQDFVALLHATRLLTSSRGAKLSAATCKPEPFLPVAAVASHIARFSGYWTRSYYLQVSREVDQMSVMCYDSGIMAPSVYGEYLSWTVRWSVQQGIDDLIIGVPTYKEHTLSHNPSVESLHTALLGLKNGLAGLDKPDRGKVGAAIYAEWTTTPDEQKDYEQEWLGSK